VDIAPLIFFNKIETPKAYHNSTLDVGSSMLDVPFGFFKFAPLRETFLLSVLSVSSEAGGEKNRKPERSDTLIQHLELYRGLRGLKWLTK